MPGVFSFKRVPKKLLLRGSVARRDLAPMDGVEEGVDVVGAAVLVL